MSEELDGMAAYYNAIQNPKRDDPNWPLPSFDARDWAEAFCKMHPGHIEDLMLTWFANALMRGYDEHAVRSAKSSHTSAREAVVEAAKEWAGDHSLSSTIRANLAEALRDAVARLQEVESEHG